MESCDHIPHTLQFFKSIFRCISMNGKLRQLRRTGNTFYVNLSTYVVPGHVLCSMMFTHFYLSLSVHKVYMHASCKNRAKPDNRVQLLIRKSSAMTRWLDDMLFFCFVCLETQSFSVDRAPLCGFIISLEFQQFSTLCDLFSDIVSARWIIQVARLTFHVLINWEKAQVGVVTMVTWVPNKFNCFLIKIVAVTVTPELGYNVSWLTLFVCSMPSVV